MESFYTYLKGPRTFWGQGNKTIINNNFFGGFPSCGFPPIDFPRFGGRMFQVNNIWGFPNSHCHCNNGSRLFSNDFFNLMAVGSLFSSIGYAMSSAAATESNLDSRLAEKDKRIKELEKENEELKAKQKEKPSENKTVTNDNKTDNSSKIGTKPNVEGAGNTQKTQEKTLDQLLNDLEGFKELSADQKKYVTERIKEKHINENGKITYDVNAIVHDGDTLQTITDRFFTKDEQANLNVAEADYNTQTTGISIKNPKTGDNVSANGVSEFGLKALISDAKANISTNSEISKTEKRLAQIKDDFISGKQKLSEAYVLQNHLMTKAEYDNIIKTKYNK